MENKNLKIHVIAVAYEKFDFIKTFVQSMLNQSKKDWILTVIHDGPNKEFDQIMDSYKKILPNNINFENTSKRYNDYGHSLREMGLKNILGDYVLLTNADNYFVPGAIEILIETIKKSNDNIDVVIFNFVASHHNYINFNTNYKRHFIDISSAIVKRELAEKAGFADKSYDGDATYFENVAKVSQKIQNKKLNILKINRTLLVHN
tara:strand:- start:2359 stop:2973 length:615 start_codon:yes stop_codon:yes gene_type:complete